MAPSLGALQHGALLYDGDDDYLAGVLPFIYGGLDADEPVFVAVPQQRVLLLRSQLDLLDPVRFVDMTDLGANPGRIIPAIREFIDDHEGRSVRFVGEPVWAGRDRAEIAEATRHEALINMAFADTAASILCPYDTRGLADPVLADAALTHPDFYRLGQWLPSERYTDPLRVYAAQSWPLAPPPPDAEVIGYHTAAALAPVRRLVRQRAGATVLGAGRVDDLILAVDELCANTLRHTPAGGTLRIWQEPGVVICEVQDTGFITDALAGRRRVGMGDASGRGLYLVNQLSDLVQLHSTPDGTIIRIRLRTQ